MSGQTTAADGMQIAIVGMAGRFPGAGGVHELWRNLMQKRESIRMFTSEELRLLGVPARISSDPAYVAAKGALDEDLTLFDAGFFYMSPHEAALLDPQHRLLLECAWEAFEDAAQDPREPRGSVGVFAGAGKNTYLLFNIAPREDLVASADLYNVLAGNEKDYLASRVAYALGLEGPSISVQTACSSGLVALHLACQSLLLRECDAAVVGAAAVDVPQVAGYHFREGAMLSRDGRCRPFDAAASGTVFGNGAVAVLLRRLDDAVADRDPIRAVIRGTATNNDGSRKSGFGVPSQVAQADVAVEALAAAAVDPASVGFIETHGTGTPLGDRIELDALRVAYGVGPSRSCLLGTLKANIGHLGPASGLAGLVKAVLALESGCIPPAAGFSRPSLDLDFARSRFAIETTASHWPLAGPRRAAVHATAIGGSNAHVILEEAPAAPARPGLAAAGRSAWLFPLSARSADGLATLAGRLAQTLEAEEPWRPEHLDDIEWTLQVGRRTHSWRHVIVAGGHDGLRQALHAVSAGAPLAQGAAPQPLDVGLVFGSALAADLTASLGAVVALRELYDDLRRQAGDAMLQAGDGRRAALDPLFAQVAMARLLQRMGLRAGHTLAVGGGDLAARCLRGELTPAALAELGGLSLAAGSPRSWHAGGEASGPAVWVVLGQNRAQRLPEPFPAAEVVSLAAPGGLLAALGRLWCLGVSLDWRALHGSQAHAVRIHLPPHPFERIRCWLSPPAVSDGTGPADGVGGNPSDAPALAGARLAVPTSSPEAASDTDRETLAALVQEHLGVGPLEPDEDFFQRGASSMNALSLMDAIEKRFRVQVPGDAIFRYSDLASLLAMIERVRSEAPDLAAGAIDDELDVTADWFLASDIRPGGRASRGAVDAVLLTGATGFLGAHLLAALLAAAPRLTVFCLVRAESPEAGRERIRVRFRDLGLDAAAIDDRVVVVTADLERHRFGLSASAFTLLAHAVEAIVHCASKVSFITSYRALKGTNVGGLREILRLAGEGREKPVHLVSSIAVFEADSLAGTAWVAEDAPLAACRGFHNGYDLSKWVAERMAGVARDRGLPVSVYRPSNIAGDSRSGAVLTDHILARFLKGCLQLGAAPADVAINLVPVDGLARAIAGRSLLPAATPSIYHLVNAEATPMRDLIRWLVERGHPLEALPYDDWAAKMLVSSRGNAFRPFLPLLVQGPLFTGRSYSRDHADADLGPAGRFAPFDETQLDRHLHHLASIDFL